MPNEMTPQEIAEKLLYLDSLIESDEDVRVLSAAASIVRKVADGEYAPIVHGKWIICSDGYYPYCSKCKQEPKSGKMSKYCPSCGALMDGKDGEK